MVDTIMLEARMKNRIMVTGIAGAMVWLKIWSDTKAKKWVSGFLQFRTDGGAWQTMEMDKREG